MCPFNTLLVVFNTPLTGNIKGSKAALNRTLDVFKLQELSEDPDPHATLPFISHHTLNLSRDLEDGKKSKRN